MYIEVVAGNVSSMRIRLLFSGLILGIFVFLGSLYLILLSGINIQEVAVDSLLIRGLRLKGLNEMEIQNIQYQSPTLLIKISATKFSWTWSELIVKEIKQCSIGSIHIQITKLSEDQQKSKDSKNPTTLDQIPFSIHSLSIESILVKDSSYRLKSIKGNLKQSKLNLSATLLDPQKQKLKLAKIQYSFVEHTLESNLQTESFLIDYKSPEGAIKGNIQGSSKVVLRKWENQASTANLKGNIELINYMGVNFRSKFSLAILDNQIELQLPDLELEQSKENILKTDLLARITLNKNHFNLTSMKIKAGSIGEINWTTGSLTSAGRLDLETATMELNLGEIKSPFCTIGKIQTIINLKNGTEINTYSTLQSIKTSEIGQFASLHLTSNGTKSAQTGTLILSDYEHKSSAIPLIRTGFDLTGEELVVDIELDEGTIHPRDYLSLVSRMQTQNSTSEEASLPLRIIAHINADRKKGIKFEDEQFQFQLIPNLKYSTSTQLEGKIHIPKGRISVGGENLGLLKEGHIHFWPKIIGHERSIPTTSLGQFSIESLDLQEFSMTMSAADAGLSTGVEIDLTFAASTSESEKKVKIGGFFPNLTIDVDGLNVQEIADAIASLYKGVGLGGSSSLGLSPENWLSGKALGLAQDKLNDELGRVGLKINASETSLGIQQKLGNKFMLELQQTHNEEQESLKSKKLNYQLNGTGSIYIQLDEKGSSGEGESSIGIQKKIRF